MADTSPITGTPLDQFPAEDQASYMRGDYTPPATFAQMPDRNLYLTGWAGGERGGAGMGFPQLEEERALADQIVAQGRSGGQD